MFEAAGLQILKETPQLQSIRLFKPIRKILKVIVRRREIAGKKQRRILGRLDDHFPDRSRDFGPNIVAPVRSSGGFRHAQNAILKAQQGYRRIGVTRFSEALVDQYRSPSLNLLDLADEKSCKIKIVNGHVQKQTATAQQKLEAWRIRVATQRPKGLEPTVPFCSC